MKNSEDGLKSIVKIYFKDLLNQRCFKINTLIEK